MDVTFVSKLDTRQRWLLTIRFDAPAKAYDSSKWLPVRAASEKPPRTRVTHSRAFRTLGTAALARCTRPACLGGVPSQNGREWPASWSVKRVHCRAGATACPERRAPAPRDE